jgi:predicted transposase YdaD
LPAAVAARIDWLSLKAEPASFVDERLRDRHADLLYSARLAGRPALPYLLLEH